MTATFFRPVCSALLLGVIAAAQPVAAQQQTTPAPGKSTGKQAPAAQAKPPAEGGVSSNEGGLRPRVEQLEEQLVDMQVVIGTLESLAKGGAASGAQSYRAPVASGGGGGDSARIDAIEVQIRALSSQVEQLTAELRASRGRSGSAAPDAGGAVRPQVGGFAQQAPSQPGTFGAVTVTPGTSGRDPIGQIIGPGDGGNPADAKQLYETAYGHLLQQDYGAAEAAFEDFLKRFPSDPLAGNAQYWLGESHYVRGQYRQAASAFLKGSQTYARSAKAPDSLLKLGMSLERLGQRDAACSSFGELSSKYPSAPSQLKDRANRERQRIGCG
jgi:tol-pal system protein YbgF